MLFARCLDIGPKRNTFLWNVFIVEWIDHLNGHLNGLKQMSNPLNIQTKIKSQKKAKLFFLCSTIMCCVCVCCRCCCCLLIWPQNRVHLCGKALSSIVLENYRILSFWKKKKRRSKTKHTGCYSCACVCVRSGIWNAFKVCPLCVTT